MDVSVRAKAIFSAMFVSLMPPLAGASTINLSTLSTGSSSATANTAAINQAINSAQSGDTIQLPAGSYAINSSINLKTGVNISGAGQSQTALQFAGTSSQPIVMDNAASNVQLTGFTLDGTSNVNASEGIAAQNCSGLKISGVTVQNLVENSDPNAEIGPQGIYFSQSVTGSVLSGNTFSNIGTNSDWGAGIRLSSSSNNNQIVNNTVTNTGRGGILLSDSSGNTITGNNVSGSGKTTAGLAIEVQGCANSLIQNNSVDHWISVDTSSGSAIRGNTISDTTGTFKLCGLELVDSQNVVFSHNTVSSGAEVGISISGNGGTSQQVYFGHNSVNGANTWGLQLQGGSGGASEIYFQSNTFNATTNGTNGQYPGNEGNGFRFNGDAHFITLNGTQVTNNQGEGVQVSGGNIGDLTFTNTKITNNSQQAIDQDKDLPDVQWTGTTAAGNGTQVTSNAVPMSVSPAQPQPTVSISAPLTLAPGAVGTFSALFVEANGTIGNVLWDFDDGLPVTTATATHSFNIPGVYDVAVVVWDGSGYAAQSEINVTVAPEPSGALALLGTVGFGLLRGRNRRISPIASAPR